MKIHRACSLFDDENILDLIGAFNLSRQKKPKLLIGINSFGMKNIQRR
jgi:hypothetical protein